jgi:hypothetical protein
MINGAVLLMQLLFVRQKNEKEFTQTFQQDW